MIDGPREEGGHTANRESFRASELSAAAFSSI